MMGLFTKVGRRRSAHATSSGKVLLAFGSQADVDDAVAGGLPRLGPRTITTRTRLNQALAEVRKAGYAVSTDEAAPGVVSIAAPIFDRIGTCVAVGLGRRTADPHAGRSSRSTGANGGADRCRDIEGAGQRPGLDPLTIDTPSSDVDGTRHNRVGSPSTSDSHVPHRPLSQPRFGLSYFARKRIANKADTSDHVANEKWWPSISNDTSRSNDLLPWLTDTRLTVRAVVHSPIRTRPVAGTRGWRRWPRWMKMHGDEPQHVRRQPLRRRAVLGARRSANRAEPSRSRARHRHRRRLRDPVAHGATTTRRRRDDRRQEGRCNERRGDDDARPRPTGLRPVAQWHGLQRRRHDQARLADPAACRGRDRLRSEARSHRSRS